jgi:hypothetical protein
MLIVYNFKIHIMENRDQQNGSDIKNIQQTTDENANGKQGTSLAEDTAINKKEAENLAHKEGTGIGGSDISGEDSDPGDIAGED